MRKPPTERTIRHSAIPFNNGNNVLNMHFDIKTPNVYYACCSIFFITEEPEVNRIVNEVCKRYKKFLKEYLGGEKQLIILDHSNYLTPNERFRINVDIAGLMSEHLSKGKLMEIGDTITTLLESMTRELNANWVLLTKTNKGRRKI